MTKAKKHLHGSPQVWEEIFSGQDLSYTERSDTQGKLFEKLKVEFLQKIFPKEGKMLEVGCGTAFVSLYFAKRGYEVFCLDASKMIIEVAKGNFEKEGAKGKFFVGNAERLPFKNGEFDLITSFGLLEHFADPQKAIDEMVRVTKKDGIVFADVVPNRFSCQTVGNIFNFVVTLIFWTLRGKPGLAYEKAVRNFRPLYFENSFSWAEYKRMFEKTGLKEIKVSGNRPFPRLTLPLVLDKLYAGLLKPAIPFWRNFDHSGSEFARFWGAGLWIWGTKR